MIKIWRFQKAPKRLQDLYRGEGTPDWVAEVPQGLAAEVEAFLGTAKQTSDVVCCGGPEGSSVYFGFSKKASTAKAIQNLA